MSTPTTVSSTVRGCSKFSVHVTDVGGDDPRLHITVDIECQSYSNNVNTIVSVFGAVLSPEDVLKHTKESSCERTFEMTCQMVVDAVSVGGVKNTAGTTTKASGDSKNKLRIGVYDVSELAQAAKETRSPNSAAATTTTADPQHFSAVSATSSRYLKRVVVLDYVDQYANATYYFPLKHVEDREVPPPKPVPSVAPPAVLPPQVENTDADGCSITPVMAPTTPFGQHMVPHSRLLEAEQENERLAIALRKSEAQCATLQRTLEKELQRMHFLSEAARVNKETSSASGDYIPVADFRRQQKDLHIVTQEVDSLRRENESLKSEVKKLTDRALRGGRMYVTPSPTRRCPTPRTTSHHPQERPPTSHQRPSPTAKAHCTTPTRRRGDYPYNGTVPPRSPATTRSRSPNVPLTRAHEGPPTCRRTPSPRMRSVSPTTASVSSSKEARMREYDLARRRMAGSSPSPRTVTPPRRPHEGSGNRRYYYDDDASTCVSGEVSNTSYVSSSGRYSDYTQSAQAKVVPMYRSSRKAATTSPTGDEEYRRRSSRSRERTRHVDVEHGYYFQQPLYVSARTRSPRYSNESGRPPFR
eukprot:PhM_4_TR4752/c0_g1_i1/m.16580